MEKLNVDCLNLIFNELKTDEASLYSCLLVNKEWCNIVVPILWKEHSSFGLWYYGHGSGKKFFNTILSCLSPSSKQFLSDNDIKLPSTILLKSPLFDYISFCIFPDAEIIYNIVEMVFGEEIRRERPNNDCKRNLLEQELYKLFVSQCKNVKELRWNTFQSLSLFPGALTCFSRLHHLCIYINFVNSNDLYEMAKFCKGLNELTIYNCQDLPGLISLIDVQRNLKGIKFFHNNNKKENCNELSKALARKSDKINYLRLESVRTILPSLFLTSLINLKEITINDCGNYEKYLEISEFPDLEVLYVNRLSCFKALAILIEKTKGNILDISVFFSHDKEAKNIGMLIKSIANNCPKVKKLRTQFEPKDFTHVKLLLLNCRYLEHIGFYSLNSFVKENDNIGDELLDILTKFSPSSLTRIILSGVWEYSIDALERLFESCRERTLLFFGIIRNGTDGRHFITDDCKVMVRKYIKEGVIMRTNII